MPRVLLAFDGEKWRWYSISLIEHASYADVFNCCEVLADATPSDCVKLFEERIALEAAELEPLKK